VVGGGCRDGVWHPRTTVEKERGPDGLYHWTTTRHWLGTSIFSAQYPTRRASDGTGAWETQQQATS
jgi:hypothetical protein